MATVQELNVVMDADPSGLEEGMNKASDATDDFTLSQEAASLATLETIAKQEAMVSSLNQVIGGYSKMGGAAQKLGLINEKQFKQFEQSRAALELMAGPLEIIIALQKLKTVTAKADTTATVAQDGATKSATASTWGFNTALLANPMVLLVAAIIAVIGALYYLEKRFKFVTQSVEIISEAFKNFFDMIEGGVKVFTDLGGAMDAVGDIGDRITGFVGSIT
jgi:hypothetical protein